MKTLEALYCVPPERDDPVVQVFFAENGPEWGEIRRSGDHLVFEVFPADSSESRVVQVDELLEVLRLARQRLIAQV